MRNSELGMSALGLSISIAVIALLLGSVVGANNLIHNAKLRRLTTEFNQLNTVVSTFRDEYGYYPGDIPNASRFWNATDCGTDSVGAIGSCNGDGDENIEYSTSAAGAPQEDIMVWKHLSLADKIKGFYDNANISSTQRYALGTNALASVSFEGGGFNIRSETTAPTDLPNGLGMMIRFGALDSSNEGGITSGGLLSAKDAQAIDDKLDDGVASAGKFNVIRGSDMTDGCINDPGDMEYDLRNTSESCQLVFWHILIN